MKNMIECCETMQQELKTGCGVIDILNVIPFTRTPQTPTAYIVSDGGYGGLEAITFCPFCGKKIEITQAK